MKCTFEFLLARGRCQNFGLEFYVVQLLLALETLTCKAHVFHACGRVQPSSAWLGALLSLLYVYRVRRHLRQNTGDVAIT